jgi:hypothetical protein
VTSLHFDIYLRSTPDRVREVLTDPGLVPRERFGMSFHADSTVQPGSSRPERRLDFEWLQTDHLETNGGHASVASFSLTPMGAVTRLSLVHRDLIPDGSLLKVVAAGWPLLLSGLKTLVETGEPLTFLSTA